jgi:hypothetical protein
VSFTNPWEENPEESDLENEGPENGSPFLSNDQQTPCSERHKHEETSTVVHYLIGELFPQGHDAKQCSLSQPEK